MFAARSLFSFSVVALTAAGLSGCASIGGTTYGTGESQEAALIEDVTGLVGGNGLLGGKKEKTSIDYSARPGLVLPPDSANLPAPGNSRAQAASLATNWPQDPDQLRRAYKERLKGLNDKERAELIASIRRLPKAQRDIILDDNRDAVAFAKQIKEPDFSKGPVNPYELKRYEEQVRKRKALILAANGQDGDSTTRKYLTQPPGNYREMSPEVQAELAKARVSEGSDKKKTGLARLWPF